MQHRGDTTLDELVHELAQAGIADEAGCWGSSAPHVGDDGGTTVQTINAAIRFALRGFKVRRSH